MKRVFKQNSIFAFIAAVLLFPSPVPAFTNIRQSAPYAWGENIGWINFQGDIYHGVFVTNQYLWGYAWSENEGWIFLGNVPLNKTSYTQDPGDTGINNDGSGNLSGYAWGENIGWIVFNPGGSGQQVTIDAGGNFSGYAWGENIGWINMNSGSGVQADLSFKIRPLWFFY